MHFTPTASSWLNLIERWFKELNDKRLRRGVFTSVADLTAAITEWPEHWNTDPKPFVWKATAEQIITKVRRGRQSPTSDVKPSTGLKLRRTTRPPGSHLGGPGLRRRHGELVALDDVREPFGLRHWDFIAVRELDDLRHFCFAALSQVDDRPEELFESGR